MKIMLSKCVALTPRCLLVECLIIATITTAATTDCSYHSLQVSLERSSDHPRHASKTLFLCLQSCSPSRPCSCTADLLAVFTATGLLTDTAH